MGSTPSNPHDTFFRRVLARPADAASELRSVIPDAIAARIDWGALTLHPGSFVSTELRSRYSDLLFRTRIGDNDAYLYLLVEHQSSSDAFMPLRMLEYLVNIWNQHIRQHPRTRLLPAVIPIVVHSNHTGCPWTASTEIAELIDLDTAARETLGPYVPRLRFLLDDIAAIDLTALLARDLTPAARVMLALHKIANANTRLGVDMLPLVDDLQAIIADHDTHLLQSVMTYIITVGDTTEADFQPLIDRLGAPAKEALVTTAERLRAEGEARGRAEGEARGRAEELAATLRDHLAVKFGAVPTALGDAIDAADLDQLRMWTRRVVTAERLDDIFGEHAIQPK